MTDDPAPTIQRLQAELAALRQALAPLASMPHLAAPLQQQLAAKEQELAAFLKASGGPAVGPVQANRDVNVATNQTIINYGAGAGPAPAIQLAEYLRALGGECNRLSLADADSSDPNRAAIELAAVYTGREVASTIKIIWWEVERGDKRGEDAGVCDVVEVEAPKAAFTSDDADPIRTAPWVGA